MDPSLAILICSAIGFAIGIVAGWIIYDVGAIHIDPKDLMMVYHTPDWIKYQRPWIVDAFYWLLRIFLLIASGRLAMFIMASTSMAVLIGPVCAILAYILGLVGYNRYYGGTLFLMEHKWLEKAEGIWLVIFVIATLGITIQFFIQPGSVQMWEGILLGVPFLLFWLTKPFDWLLTRPVEISTKRQLYNLLGNDPEMIRRAEAMRRRPPLVKRNYRELLEHMNSMMQIEMKYRR